MKAAPFQESLKAYQNLLDDKAAAELLDVTPGTLSVWRSTGRYGLPFLKIGRNVRYRREEGQRNSQRRRGFRACFALWATSQKSECC